MNTGVRMWCIRREVWEQRHAQRLARIMGKMKQPRFKRIRKTMQFN